MAGVNHLLNNNNNNNNNHNYRSGIIRRVNNEEYELEKELVQGGVWRVSKARRKRDQLPVAFKEAALAQCRGELAILNKLKEKRNVVQLLTWADQPPQRVLIVELCSTELSIFLQDLPERRLAMDQLKVAARHLTTGYQALYQQGILHKNLSSKNVLVSLQRNCATLKISGFNCSEIIQGADSDCRRTIVGRPTYMAPEIRALFAKGQRKADYDAKSDLWSIGLLLYECTAGTEKASALSGQLLEAYLAGNYRTAIGVQLHTPALVRMLMEQLLRIPAADRLTPEAFFAHMCIRSTPEISLIQLEPSVSSRLSYALIPAAAPPPPPPVLVAAPQIAAPPFPSNLMAAPKIEDRRLIRVRNYEYVDEPSNMLGQGSFGKVWRAKRSTDGVEVALKRVHKDDVDMAEVETMQSLLHANLLRLHDWFEQYPYMYLVTELCARDLEALLQRPPRFGRLRSEHEARVLAKHLSSGYMAMKTANILHRDIKPSNVLVGIQRNMATFKLADFGCSKKLSNECYAQTVLGTPLFMAPELGASLYLKSEHSRYDHRADIWSMGFILHKSLVGQLPFDESTLRKLFYDVGKGRSTAGYARQFKHDCEKRRFGEQCRDLLRKAVCPDYLQRMTAEEFFRHPFHSSLPVNCELEV